MKKNKNEKQVKDSMPLKPAGPGFAKQDFIQGRGGAQSGHNAPTETFNQFENKGDGGFASEQTPNSTNETDKK